VVFKTAHLLFEEESRGECEMSHISRQEYKGKKEKKITKPASFLLSRLAKPASAASSASVAFQQPRRAIAIENSNR
jgi:hypothetical protein